MHRIAAHGVYWRRFYTMSYIELTDDGLFNGVFPLEVEIAGTEFYDGLLIPVDNPERLAQLNQSSDLLHEIIRSNITEHVFTGAPACLYRIHRNKIYVI
jgi:hypothetical protein